MTPIEFQTLVAKANEALESEEPIPNEDELELLTFIGGYGSAMYYVLLDKGVSTYNELMAKRKTDRNFLKEVSEIGLPNIFLMQGQKGRLSENSVFFRSVSSMSFHVYD